MATWIEMPKLSDTMTEGTLLKWHIKEGDSISVGDTLADVETDKATMDMNAFDEGIMGKLYIGEGEKAAVGSYIAVLVEEGEDAPDSPPSSGAAPSSSNDDEDDKSESSDSKPKSKGKSGGGSDKPAPASSGAQIAARTSSGRIKASPLARKIAEKRGVDLGSIAGTGPGGRIVKADVENAPVGGGSNGSGGGGAPQAPGAAAIRPTMDFDDQAERIPLSGMRAIIAERLLASKTQIPHFYLNAEMDVEPLMKIRKQVNEKAEESGNKFTFNDFVLKAAILANQDVPEANSAFDFDSVIRYHSVNLSVAIAVPDGLVTPVIRDAQDKTLLEISKSVKDLAQRAKDKKLSPEEFQGGTLTVSNLGSYGIDNFDAIINPPQSIILSVGAIKAKPVVNDKGEIVVGQRMWVGLSCDHRVVDGAVGAMWIQAFRKYLENPALMLV